MSIRIRIDALMGPLLVLAFATAHAANPVDVVTAKGIAAADEASVTGAAKDAMLAAQRALLDAGVAECARDQAKFDFSPFVVVMRLDAQGRAVETWREGISPLAICLQRYVRGKQVFVPPRSPFHTALEVSFEK